MAFERITIDHEKMGGLPCIRHLRIPVGTILGQLTAGRDAREVLEDFPDLEPTDILAALEYAAAAHSGAVIRAVAHLRTHDAGRAGRRSPGEPAQPAQ